MKVFGAPYPTIGELPSTLWHRVLDGSLSPVESDVDAWDPSLDLEFQRSVTLPHDQLIDSSGLGPGSRVRLVAGWHCDATRTRAFTSELDLTLRRSDDVEVELTCSVPGTDVAVAVTLETKLVLLAAAPKSSPVSAKQPGSVLWADELRVALEGIASRFPTEWIDFASAPYPSEAAWYLDWDPSSPEYSVLGGMRLYLNSNHAKLKRTLEGKQPESLELWQRIRLDVARQMLEAGLRSPEFVENIEAHPDETVGAAVRRLVSVVFPGDSLHAVRDLLQRSPGRFEAMLQQRLGYLEGDQSGGGE